tara:strand:+ start:129 stop:629 length:501 start_codon:yes stop_codon:yes gene_type:complete
MNRYKFLLDRVATDVFAWPRGPQHPPLFYVTIYKVTRCYGGPEEGGWNYDHTDYLSSCPVRNLEYANKLFEALKAEPSLQKQSRPYPVSPMHGDPRDPMNDSDDWTPRGAGGDTRYEFCIEVMPDHPNLTHCKASALGGDLSFYVDGDRRFYPVGSKQTEGIPRYE